MPRRGADSAGPMPGAAREIAARSARPPTEKRQAPVEDTGGLGGTRGVSQRSAKKPLRSNEKTRRPLDLFRAIG